MAFLRLLSILSLAAWLHGAAIAQSAPAIALHYGSAAPLDELRVFDIAVVEPGHGQDPERLRTQGTELYAYVSVAEVQPSRPYYTRIPAEWKLARNGAWNSDVIDQTPAAWPEFFATEVVAPLWQRGFRGFFLDTLDSYRLAAQYDEAAQQDGLVRVIDTLHARFPGIQLIVNRGFEIVPRVKSKIRMVAAESLYQGWNAKAQRYEEVRATDRDWLLGQLRTIRERDGLPVLAIDYVPPHDRALTRETAARIQKDGFIPWVTDAELSTLGIGSVEPVPRRVLVLYNSAESPALNYANPHRYLQMPLNHMGYVVDYADALQPLPKGVYRDRYAGVVTWFSGFIPAQRRKEVSQWLLARMDENMPLAIVGDWGQAPDRMLARKLGLGPREQEPQGALGNTLLHPMMGLEAPPPPPGRQPELQLLTNSMAQQSQPLIALKDQRGQTFVGGAITPWGGFILDPNVIVEIPGTDQSRWIVDPFAFLQQSLRLPPIPIPDTTTENGRRLLLVHVDGDGFNSLAEFAGSPPAAQVLLKQVFEKYRIPQTMSIIEAEVAPHGLTPELSPRLEAIAREMFRLPHIEVGSHTYSHPFLWDTSVRHGLFAENPEAAYNLTLSGYTMDLEREIAGSSAYINQKLAPPGKPVKILQWTGDTAPSAQALEITERAGLLNINGGDTSISRMNPSITAIGALGIVKNGYLQVYAPITNENIYTNLWIGPFYGFERVLETFEMTDTPRRIKPVGIYYHTYSASKPAALKALHKVYDWALARPLHPVHAVDFAAKVRDFFHYAMARDGDGWRLRGDGALRTVRLPSQLGQPLPNASIGVAGWRPGTEAPYIHLTGGSALLRTAAPEAPRKNTSPPLYLHEANARITHWASDTPGRGVKFTLSGHVPLEFSLAGTDECQVQANRQPIQPAPRAADARLRTYRLAHAVADIQIRCPAR